MDGQSVEMGPGDISLEPTRREGGRVKRKKRPSPPGVGRWMSPRDPVADPMVGLENRRGPYDVLVTRSSGRGCRKMPRRRDHGRVRDQGQAVCRIHPGKRAGRKSLQTASDGSEGAGVVRRRELLLSRICRATARCAGARKRAVGYVIRPDYATDKHAIRQGARRLLASRRGAFTHGVGTERVTTARVTPRRQAAQFPPTTGREVGRQHLVTIRFYGISPTMRVGRQQVSEQPTRTLPVMSERARRVGGRRNFRRAQRPSPSLLTSGRLLCPGRATSSRRTRAQPQYNPDFELSTDGPQASAATSSTRSNRALRRAARRRGRAQFVGSAGERVAFAYEPHGHSHRKVRLPDRVSNLAFGGPMFEAQAVHHGRRHLDAVFINQRVRPMAV